MSKPRTKDLLGMRGLHSMMRFKDSTKLASSGCVEWIAYKNPQGYGVMGVGGTYYSAHRLSWAWANSQNIPEGMFICHTCDNPPCVNPEHLWPGTALDNKRDCINKGRSFVPHQPGQKGSKNPIAKLTEDAVVDIRKLKAQGWSYGQLAKKYGVKNVTVYHVVKRNNWKHVAEIGEK